MIEKFKGGNNKVGKLRVLLVDDSEDSLMVFREGLELQGFEVVGAGSAAEAQKYIETQSFNVLLCDLHMPDQGGGLSIVSTMRNLQPKAVTLVLSGYPAMPQDDTVLLHTDEVLMKPVGLATITYLIQSKLRDPHYRMTAKKENVETILDREHSEIIRRWLLAVQMDRELSVIPLSALDRTAHLPQLISDLIRRLRSPHIKSPISSAARDHGELRRKQGYSVPMVVEESRLLQVSIFGILQKNLHCVEFAQVLPDVMVIADEVDSQLKQALHRYTELSMGLWMMR